MTASCTPHFRVDTRRLVLATFLATLGCAAKAAEIANTDDWSVRWDNTLKASTKYRLHAADAALMQSFVGGNPANGPQALNFNAGNQNFQRRGIVSERLDLLSEFDAVWRRDFGLRLSAAGWLDQKIRGRTAAGDDFFNGQSPSNEMPDETRRQAGRKAELLDAFMFGGVRLANEMKLKARLGRHGLQYGESLFFGDNGIARAQGPIDIDKLLAAPNAQFKEIIRPVPQLSAQLQVLPELSVGGYYQFRWEHDRLPAAGTYFSTSNIPWDSLRPEFATLPADVTAPTTLVPFLLSSGAERSARNSGQYGLQLKWRVDGTDLGAYVARYHDKGGQLYGQVLPNATPSFGAYPGNWYFKFPEGIRTVGISASRSVGAFNLAAEASVRHNMPLRNGNMFYGMNVTTPGGVFQIPEPRFAVGKTAHVNFSWFALLAPNFLADETGFLGELAWNRVLSLRDPDGQLDKSRTRDATALRIVISPAYKQVLPGLDMSLPIGLGYSLQGRSAITAWGAKNTGDLSLGIELNYLGTWQMGVSFTHYIGKAIPFIDYSTLATLGAPTLGSGNPLADRDFIAFSLRRTF